MAKTVLLVMGDQGRDLADPLTQTFEEADITVIPQKNERSALRIIREMTAREMPFDFIASALSLAPDPASPALADGGIAFCEYARAISPAPIALIAPAITNALQLRLAHIPPPSPILFGVDAELPAILLQQVLAAKVAPRRLDVVVRADAGSDWTYDLRGTGFAFDDRHGRLSMTGGTLDAIKAAALGLDSQNWAEIFRTLGGSIIKCFFEQNDDFRQQLRAGLKAAGGLENTRVTFIVADVHYEIALEAILTPLEEVPEPWMIHAPLVRNIASAFAASAQLFEGPPRPLRCLILCADTSGRVDIDKGGPTIYLPPLPHIRKECEEVRRLFSRVSRQLGFDEPRVEGVDTQLTPERLLDVLRDPEPWDVVHYAGHSHHTRDNPAQASLIVGEKEVPVAVRMNEIAPYLRRSKLVYLSSCNSANAGFAFEAVQQGIPAVVGFRWGLRDDLADIHARLFYRRLFKDRAIDTALWKTRRAMHRLKRDDRTWASSMLLMQSR